MTERISVPAKLVNHPLKEASKWIAGEPSVQDVVGDPLVHAVLRRDGLSLRDLQQAIALGRHRLGRSPRTTPVKTTPVQTTPVKTTPVKTTPASNAA